MLRLLALIFVFLMSSFYVDASHIVGGDFTATWISANSSNTASTYRLRLTLYRDCETGTAAFDPSILIGIFDKFDNSLVDSVSINLTAVGPLTLALANQCSPPPQVCVEGGVYIANVVIPNNPAGYYMSWERCCRNITVNNLVRPDDTGITFYLEIPDPQLHNSTPVFSSDPLTYMCEEQPFEYDFGASDPDGDSLAFELITPVSGNIGFPANGTPLPVWPAPLPAPYTNAMWAPGYSLNNICGGVPLQIDPLDGKMTAVPDFFGRYSAAVECREYRNGIQIGMIRREIQFNVIICNTNSYPDISFNSAIKELEIDAEDTICFSYFVRDNEGDSLFLSVAGEVFPGGAAGPPYAWAMDKSDIANLSTDFCWTPACSHVRADAYEVIFTSKDNGCPFPLTVSDTIRITVNAVPVPKPAKMLCMDLTRSDSLELFFGMGTTPSARSFNYYLVYRSVNGSAFTVYDTLFNPSAQSFFDPAAFAHNLNNYCYFIVGRNSCEVDGLPSDTICSFESVSSISNYIESVSVSDDGRIVLTWQDFINREFSRIHIFRKINAPNESFQAIDIIQNPAVNYWIDASANSAQHSYCYYIFTEDVCGNVSSESNYACSILLNGTSEPFKHSMFWNLYEFWNGGVDRYELWRKGGKELNFSKIFQSSVGLEFDDEDFHLNEGRYHYRIRAVEGLGSSGASSFSNTITLDQDPLVFLPNAFSPNDDQINDRWGSVSSFVKEYHLQLFNRWGQLVFSSRDPQYLWDGRFNGIPAPEGVYIYYLAYEAYDNSDTREIKGTVTLLR